MRRMKDLLRQRQGVTLAELMAASALMCVVLGMAAACVHPAAAALRRTHQLQEAQLILDTVLTQVRMEAEGGYGWIYLSPVEDGTQTAAAVTFLDENGTEVTLDASHCRAQFAPAFFRGMELELRFSPAEGGAVGERAEMLMVEAALYRGGEERQTVAVQRIVICLRHGPVWTAEQS